MGKKPSPVPKERTCVNIEVAIWKKFKEICKREGETMSGKLEKFMQQYNQAHSIGNPQLTISAYAKPEEQQPMWVLCVQLDGATTEGQVHCKKAGMWVPGVRCYSCDKNLLRKKK